MYQVDERFFCIKSVVLKKKKSDNAGTVWINQSNCLSKFLVLSF